MGAGINCQDTLFPFVSSFGIPKSTRADSPQGVLIMALGEAAGSQCCGPVGGVGRILWKEVQIPPASGQFLSPPPWKRWRPSRAHWRSGAAEAKFGSAVAGPVADGQQGLVLETPQRSLWRSASASTREVALTRRPEPLPAGICPEAPSPENPAPHWGASGRLSAGNKTFLSIATTRRDIKDPTSQVSGPLGLAQVPGKPRRAKLASS